MSKKTATYGAAGAGVTAGVVGLVLLTVPGGAGAGPAPALPKTTPEALLQSVMQAKPTAFNGTVEVQNDLGLPALPQLPQLANGDSEAQIWTNGANKLRASLPYGGGERTFVSNGKTFWMYNSADHTATKLSPGELAKGHEADGREWAEQHKDQAQAADPASASREIISAIRQFSNVQVDGTSSVAGRDAYQLVLTPKPTERTLLREVRVAVDYQTKMPLQLDVFTNGTPDPALRVGFSELQVGPQDPARFEFTPPAGTKVETPSAADMEQQLREHGGQHGEQAKQAMEEIRPQLVGSGWDTVLTAKLPKEALSGQSGEGAEGMNPTMLLQQFGKQVSGEFGKGWVLSTKVGTALITEDGRVAAGFVPQQVLANTLAGAK